MVPDYWLGSASLDRMTSSTIGVMTAAALINLNGYVIFVLLVAVRLVAGLAS